MRVTEQSAYPGWVRLTYGAASGAVVAIILGFGLSAWFHILGLGLIIQSEDARSAISQFVGRAGLNFQAIHNIRIAGSGLPGGPEGLTLSISWPITLWAIIPAVSLMLGGLVSSKLSGVRGTGRFMAGAYAAVPYTIFLLIARPFCTASTAAVRLPQFEIGGWNPAPELIAARLIPAFGSTIFFGLAFGIIFGGIGALGGIPAIIRGLFRREAYMPAWLRGALISFLIGSLIFFLLFALYIGFGLRRQGNAERQEQVRSAVTLLPAASGLAYYVSHGVTIRGGTSSTVDPEGGFRLRAGLIRGVETDGRERHIPGAVYLAFLIPVVALVLGGYYAAKTANEPIRKAPLAAGVAGAYGVIMALLTPIYTLVQRSSFVVGDVTNTAAITLGPPAAEAFVLGLAIAFVFGLIGVNIYRPYARP